MRKSKGGEGKSTYINFRKVDDLLVVSLISSQPCIKTSSVSGSRNRRQVKPRNKNRHSSWLSHSHHLRPVHGHTPAKGIQSTIWQDVWWVDRSWPSVSFAVETLLVCACSSHVSSLACNECLLRISIFAGIFHDINDNLFR